MNCKFRNAGQTCISSNRILVQEGVYDKFAKMVTEKVNALSCGDSLTKGTTMGPLINKNGLAKVSRQVQDSLKKGAVATTGGKPHEEFNSQGMLVKDNNSLFVEEFIFFLFNFFEFILRWYIFSSNSYDRCNFRYGSI